MLFKFCLYFTRFFFGHFLRGRFFFGQKSCQFGIEQGSAVFAGVKQGRRPAFGASNRNDPFAATGADFLGSFGIAELTGVFFAAELLAALGAEQLVFFQIGSAVFAAPGCFFLPLLFYFDGLLLSQILIFRHRLLPCLFARRSGVDFYHRRRAVVV
ncbi:MAG: hypothetical protein LBH15_05495 [Treponema sp.]|nr:hypothetical protein [Treponema sp.]